MHMSSIQASARPKLVREIDNTRAKSIVLVMLMLFSTLASIEFVSYTALANTDQDGDGLTYGLEYLINTQPNDWDSDNDQLPDGWEWQYGLDPLSDANDDGAIGDPDGDGFSNLQEYNYRQPSNWDLTSTTSVLDNGVWWNGTIPVNNWDEENAMQYNQLACGDPGSDGTGSVILCDEDPLGNICTDGIDNDKDGMVDSNDNDFDGDADCASNDDDGDGVADEDRSGWDTDGDGMPDGWEASNGLNATSPSNADGANGDPDNDGLINIFEYINPSWDTTCGGQPCLQPGPDNPYTETISPCAPHQLIGPGGCATLTAETDGITSTNPNDSDTDNDGLNDSYEALTLRTDPTNSDTDYDGINDGVEVNGQYGNPPQASDPRNNNTDGDAFDDGDEDTNGNGLVDSNETDPTRREDSGDFDNDGLENWQENLSCTLWNVADTDSGGVNDGDESNVTHGTDPCDSLINFATTTTQYNAVSSQLTVSDGSGFNPGGGIAFYNNSGAYTQFSYATVVNSVLQGVNVPHPFVGVDVETRNNSWCHDLIAPTYPTYCDDDYSDSDGDGLADWEEILGTYGYFSNPTLFDTDGDGVNDFDEVLVGTDPLQPCDNLLDDDGDGLNNYFEVTTGCDNAWIGITNGSQDIYSTNESMFDTDQGGINDKQEYFDSTNPEDNPADDILPEDFDGDGIPDAVENATGTDWRNPDTDGGGMLDGEECEQMFWFTNCQGSPFDPFDPSDDITSSDVVFWANNSSGTVDLNREHMWKLNTYDFYTGGAYGTETGIHVEETISTPYENTTHLAPSSYANNSVSWIIEYNNPPTSGRIPISAYQHNISLWTDFTASLSRTNDSHNYEVLTGPLDSIWVEENEYWFDWATISADTIAGTNSSYELILPEYFTNNSLQESIVNNITNDVINAAGATDAYSKADAIATFLRDGNATYDFKRNYNGTGGDIAVDVVFDLLFRANEGTCSQFTTTFVTMARLAGIPARFVSGYRGGNWNGNGYTIFSNSLTQWGEVRLELSQSAGGDDLGWIPFDACPTPESIEIVNVTWTPTEYDRDGSTEVNVTGTLQYTENTTGIPGIFLQAYLVDDDLASFVPGIGATDANLIGIVQTDANGNFSINGTVLEAPPTGFAKIAIEHIQSGYVSNDAIDLGVFVNLTDDANLTHESPLAINQPILGAGSTTTISGRLLFENNQTTGAENLNISVWLDFVSSVDGQTNLSSVVGANGNWEINVTLDELETKTNISATLGFSGWVDTSQSFSTPQFHLRPVSNSITLDVRDAPNLTATIEGPGSNNSIFQLGQTVYINGTAQSFGASPTALSGNLSFGMRRANTGADYFEVFNTSVNGNFAITHVLPINNTPIEAGPVELELIFYPDNLDATDNVNTSGTDWWLEGLLFFELQANSQLRGTEVSILVQVTDHLGFDFDLNLTGNFTFDFNGSLVNTTSNPALSILSPTFTTSSNIPAGDYQFDMSFDGNRFFMPSTNTSSLRIMGTVDVTVEILDDWTFLGNTSYIFGNITDDVFNTPVLNNDTVLIIQIINPDGSIFDGATGNLNNTTGSYNLTITAPTTFASGVYDVQVMPDFTSLAPDGGAYYQWVDSSVPPSPPQVPSTTWGIESEVQLTLGDATSSDVIAVMNNTVDLDVRVTDIADNSNVSGKVVEYIFDYGGQNLSIANQTTDATGNASLQWLVSGVDPGQYILRMVVADDLSAAKAQGATRHYGNYTELNITVQVDSIIRVDSIPANVTAGVNFNVIGQVEDGDNQSRNLTSAVAIDIFWLDNPSEKLINGVYTSSNGSFNLSVPTDVLNNGTKRGPRTLIISVVEGSSPFYLTSSSNHSILVRGVTLFENLQPLNPIVVNRGQTVNISAKLVESSDMWQPLPNLTVDVQFDETWLVSNTTNAQGDTTFNHTVPINQPLGLITITIYYNGTTDLLPTQSSLSTVTIRSITLLVVNPIDANPIAGETFNINGTIESDNGSSLQLRNGDLLSANILFAIDGMATGFTLTDGVVKADGTWSANITLSNGFAAGNHTAQATYIPSVNYYEGSTANETFDSRGYTVLLYITPTMDGADTPSLNDRTERGTDVNPVLQLSDNTGAPVAGVSVNVTLNGSSVTVEGISDSSGRIDVNLSIPVDFPVGFQVIYSVFDGIDGTTGLIGDDAQITFVVLAQTVVNITETSETIVAGEKLYVNGTLLDDLDLPLLDSGVNSSGVVYLLVDGVPVSSVLTDADTGQFLFEWNTPNSITAGSHNIQVVFNGGRDWVDPIGEGDSANPEYYLPSVDSVNFTVAVPTKIILITQGGQVDREGLLTVEGWLSDLVNNPLPNETIEIWLGGEFLTNVTTAQDGGFTALYAVPADSELGPVVMEAKFNGSTNYLPSNNSGIWTVFSQIVVTVNIESQLATDQQTTIDGFVGDNQLEPLEGMVVLISIEGISIGNATTDENGNFTFDWTVPNIFTDGEHIVDVNVPAQGYYRAGYGNSTFFLAHKTGLAITIQDADATRGDFWYISGTLYDLDTALNDGLAGETVNIYIDGVMVESVFTSISGEFVAQIRAESAYARGDHLLTFDFEGSPGHLPVETNKTVVVWSEVTVHIDSTSGYVIRSDSVNSPIVITGRISEIGGQGVVIDGMDLILGETSDCGGSEVGSRCINSNVIWNGATFTITATAPTWLSPGQTQLNVQMPSNSSLYLRDGSSWTGMMSIVIDATFDVDIEPVVEDEQETIMGEIQVIADDTEEGVQGIAVSIYLEYENGTRLDDLVVLTDSNGVAEFEFNAEPPYGDASEYGELMLKMTVSSNGILSSDSVNQFNTQFSSGVSPSYSYAGETESVPWWMYVLAVLVVGAGVAFVMMRRKAAETAKEIADIFSYTAELLAAGDSMREAIFQCYESLVHLLMGKGFLRRDFETVREFEMAIRAALPQLSEESLSSLDAVFEEARYSRHEMGESDKIKAQESLTRVVSEINQFGNIPSR